MAFLKFLGVLILVVGAFVFGVNVGIHGAEQPAAEREAALAAPRCQRLAALIPPITAEIDRVLASGGRDLHDLEMRRIEIQGEMRLEGCR